MYFQAPSYQIAAGFHSIYSYQMKSRNLISGLPHSLFFKRERYFIPMIPYSYTQGS